jgi:glutamate-1-semialdehyde 2,1-aminomutase
LEQRCPAEWAHPYPAGSIAERGASQGIRRRSNAIAHFLLTHSLGGSNRSQIFKEAQTLLPGGVNSPVRAFKSVGGQPIVFERVKGPYCWDVDGNKYVDYVGSWGPAIVGHANDEVNAALKAQIEKGTSFGAPCELEVRGSASSP